MMLEVSTIIIYLCTLNSENDKMLAVVTLTKGNILYVSYLKTQQIRSSFLALNTIRLTKMLTF